MKKKISDIVVTLKIDPVKLKAIEQCLAVLEAQKWMRSDGRI